MSYHHFTLCERGKIELMRKQGHRAAAIGRELGYHESSVRREIRRNAPPHGYDALAAQRSYQHRRKACRPKGRLAYEPLRDPGLVEHSVEELVAQRLYPGFLTRANPAWRNGLLAQFLRR